MKYAPSSIGLVISVLIAGMPGTSAYARHAPECRAAVLVYHHIGTHRVNESTAERHVTIAPEAFERHMRFLHDERFVTVPYGRIVDCVTRGKPLPDKAVAITFDDGIASQYTKALPILERYGHTATFFIVTSFIGHNRLLMTWDQIRDLDARGMTIGSHTQHHPNLTTLTRERLMRELADSKRDIEAHIGKPVLFLAHPFGSLDERTIAAAKEAGYASARSIHPSKLHRREDLFRLRITYAPEGLETFRRYMNTP